MVLEKANDVPKAFIYGGRVERFVNPIIPALGVFVDFVLCEAVSVDVQYRRHRLRRSPLFEV